MENPNPHSPLEPTTSATSRGLTGSTHLLLLSLVAAQAVLTIFSLPSEFEHLRVGEISPLTFLGILLTFGLLALGGLLVLLKSRYAAFPFAAATLVGLLTATSWHPVLVLTSVAVNFISALVVFFVGWRTGA